MDASLTISLVAPIHFDGASYASFTIRAPTAEDYEAACRVLNVGRRVRGLRFIARLIDIPQRSFEEVERRDERAARAVANFIDYHMGW